MSTLFNTDQYDFRTEPMFFGKDLGIARSDISKHEIFNKLAEKQLGFFWRPEEVDIATDKHQFEALDEHEKHIFTSNLKYQILLDSVQGRSPTSVFSQVTSLPEMEDWIAKWAFSETIHSNSYTHIIQGIYNSPSEQFDDILRTPEIIERAIAVTADYDKIDQMIMLYRLKLNTQQITASDGTVYEPFTLRELKHQFMRTMYQIQIVEAIRFYVSFACSFAFAERSLMEGNAKIIKLILRDEVLHFQATREMIQLWKDGTDDLEMTSIYNEMEASGELVDMYKATVEQEKDWADYLFKDGSMIGLNADILKQYLEYMTNIRMNQVGLPMQYPTKENPLPWMNSWADSDGVQVAPQETEQSSYLTAAVDNSIDRDALGGFDLD